MPKQCESWVLFSFMFVMQHLGTWWSTLKGNTVTGSTSVSKLFTICLDLMFAGKYMQFSFICSLLKSLRHKLKKDNFCIDNL
jgi:hypothetical protein